MGLFNLEKAKKMKSSLKSTIFGVADGDGDWAEKILEECKDELIDGALEMAERIVDIDDNVNDTIMRIAPKAEELAIEITALGALIRTQPIEAKYRDTANRIGQSLIDAGKGIHFLLGGARKVIEKSQPGGPLHDAAQTEFGTAEYDESTNPEEWRIDLDD